MEEEDDNDNDNDNDDDEDTKRLLEATFRGLTMSLAAAKNTIRINFSGITKLKLIWAFLAMSSWSIVRVLLPGTQYNLFTNDWIK